MDEAFSRKVRAGRRTYYFDVRPTQSGEDFFITITETKFINEFSNEKEKHKVFLYKEDFEKFYQGLREAMVYVKQTLEGRGKKIVSRDDLRRQRVETEGNGEAVTLDADNSTGAQELE